MKYFRCIRKGIPVAPLLSEIAATPDAWDLSTGRQDKIDVQREAMAIPIRGLRKSMIAGRPRWDVQESRWTTASINFPLVRDFLNDAAATQGARLGRAKIVSLPAGRRVYPHIDRGEYYRFHDRYHLVLKSSLGSWLKSGDEEVRMREGELWWFDNGQVHEAMNDGDEDRIHIIFDMLPNEIADQVLGIKEKRATIPFVQPASLHR